MTINKTTTPAAGAGAYLTEKIEKEGQAVLCLISGGSALEVVEHIELTPAAKRRTIFMMGDERWSREEGINNYLQLKDRYPDFVQTHAVVDTSVQKDESQEAYAARVHSTIDVTLHEHDPMFVIALMGLGEDGHTAGIFPMGRGSFRTTYPADTTFTSVITSGLSVNFRASITPDWIHKNVDEIVLYAVGSGKRDILHTLVSEQKPVHELPAMLIKEHPHATVFTDQAIE